MNTKTEQERETIAARAVAELRTAIRTPEDERAPILRRAAGHLVRLRGLYTTKAGDPDWRGQSWDYRQKVGEIYAAAGLDAAGESGVKVALRYHIGNALREDLSEDELEQAGLSPKPPRERTSWRYKEGANQAEFARHLVYRMVRTPAMEPDKETLEHARELRDEIDRWLRRHSKALSTK